MQGQFKLMRDASRMPAFGNIGMQDAASTFIWLGKWRTFWRGILLMPPLLVLGTTQTFAQFEEVVQTKTYSEKRRVCSRAPFSQDLSRYNALPWEIFRRDKKFKGNYEKLLRENVNHDDFRWLVSNMVSKEAWAFHHETEGDLIGFQVCKPHWCDSENAMVLFKPKSKYKSAVIKLNQNGYIRSFGQITPNLISECFGNEEKR